MATLYRSPSTPPFDCNDFPMQNDYGGVPPTSPPPYAPLNTPLTSAYHSYGPGLPHDLGECVHTTRLCDQRYAHLQALVANLERCQCRCRQSTWSRLTKCFLGSLRERAASLKLRTKSQRPPSLEQEASLEPSYKNPAFWWAEYPTTSPDDRAIELHADPCPIAELNAPSSARVFNGVAGQATHAGVQAPSLSYPQGFKYAHAGYELDSSFHELPAPHTMAGYRSHPPTTPRNMSTLTTSTASRQDSRSESFFSPPSSMSSAPSSLPPDIETSGAAGVPIFATDTTSSPLEYGQNDLPWNGYQPSPHHSTTNRAELPAWPPVSGVGAADSMPEMGGAMLSMSPTTSLSPTHPMQPQELPANTNIQLGYSGWGLPQRMVMDNHPITVPGPSYNRSYHPQAPASWSRPQPVTTNRTTSNHTNNTNTIPNTTPEPPPTPTTTPTRRTTALHPLQLHHHGPRPPAQDEQAQPHGPAPPQHGPGARRAAAVCPLSDDVQPGG
ncbi:hypothetical protein B0I37DRAFT_118475 [Chaetomium sp. MPI-CAGE-AT-0009]|nr:hypothetical protein B0I37DRAFT_118475 [Chaetomium sp. MPI-CAGE-AT-0009]